MASGRIVFFGTSKICLPFLNELVKTFNIELIITQPDKKGGRKNKVIIPPVKLFAQENHIEYIQPESLDEKTQKIIESKSPDIGVAIAYGKLIPKSIFQAPVYNTINVHFSLLPEYRGAAPVQRAIENGEKKSGISIFEISKKMDAGRIWSQDEFKIEPFDNTETLWEKLSIHGAPILSKTIKNIIGGTIIKKKQNHANATYSPQISKSEGEINWSLNASQIFNKFRAFYPWPGIFFRMNNKIFKINNTEVSQLNHNEEIGRVIKLDTSGLYISCANNSVLKINSFQPEGKKPMSPNDYSRGNKISLN